MPPGFGAGRGRGARQSSPPGAAKASQPERTKSQSPGPPVLKPGPSRKQAPAFENGIRRLSPSSRLPPAGAPMANGRYQELYTTRITGSFGGRQEDPGGFGGRQEDTGVFVSRGEEPG